MMVRAHMRRGPGSHANLGGSHLPKQSVVRRVVGCGLALGLVVWVGGTPVADAQEPQGPCAQIPCASLTTDSTWCWCPDQRLSFSTDPVATDPRAGYEVGVDNRLPIEVDLVDQSGAVAATIPPGATGRLAVPGPGQHAYTVTAPRVLNPPVLTVVGLPN
jgi:hypothetical protein